MMYKAILLLLLWSICSAQATSQVANGISKGYIEMSSQNTLALHKEYIINHHHDA